MKQVSFADLESNDLHSGSGQGSGEMSPLEKWYEAVRHVPIAELKIGDLSRACRQQLFLSDVLPIALAALNADPTAGDKYEGELAHSILEVKREFWSSHIVLLRQAVDVFRSSAPEICDYELKSKMENFVRMYIPNT